MYQNFDLKEEFQINAKWIEPKAIYYFKDIYYCNYVLLRLPAEEGVLVIGPYAYKKIGVKQIHEIMESLSLSQQTFSALQNYYYNIPIIYYEEQFKNLISLLADEIWQGNENYKIYMCNHNFLKRHNDPNFSKLSLEEISFSYVNTRALELQYEFENRCMNLVSSGNQNLIDQVLARQNELQILPLTADSLRDYKNYLLKFNTLLRKAAEYGGVHPVYLEQLSTKFSLRIEAAHDTKEKMLREILYKYCLLVRNHSVKQYSSTIQQMVNYINLNLKEDLSLKTLAKRFHLSASYLSALSKKELGMTLTNYVNMQRIEHSIFLLNVTERQIQEIAADCGFNDITYFTRTFKKLKGMTPTKYRELISQKL